MTAHVPLRPTRPIRRTAPQTAAEQLAQWTHIVPPAYRTNTTQPEAAEPAAENVDAIWPPPPRDNTKASPKPTTTPAAVSSPKTQTTRQAARTVAVQNLAVATGTDPAAYVTGDNLSTLVNIAEFRDTDTMLRTPCRHYALVTRANYLFYQQYRLLGTNLYMSADACRVVFDELMAWNIFNCIPPRTRQEIEKIFNDAKGHVAAKIEAAEESGDMTELYGFGWMTEITAPAPPPFSELLDSVVVAAEANPELQEPETPDTPVTVAVSPVVAEVAVKAKQRVSRAVEFTTDELDDMETTNLVQVAPPQAPSAASRQTLSAPAQSAVAVCSEQRPFSPFA